MKIVDLKYKDLKMYIFNKKSTTNDMSYIEKRADEIFNILKKSYEKLGGCYIYKSVAKMKEMASRYKVVMNKNQEIFGVATYRNFVKTNSFKCILIGRNFDLDDNDGKEAVKWIIKSDIINWKHLYWIEAYDAIGHWEEKYGAFKIPSVYVPNILGPVGIKTDSSDEYVYYRLIQGIDEPQPKIMYGFESEERIKQMLNDEQYIEYENYIKKLYDGKVDNSIYESEYISDRYTAVINTLYFIEDRYNEQNQFHNITKQTYQIMVAVYKEGLSLIKSNKLSIDQKNEMKSLCNLCKRIAKEANILSSHKMF